MRLKSRNLKKMLEKMRKIENKYEEAEGKPVLQARLMKSAETLEKRIEFLRG